MAKAIKEQTALFPEVDEIIGVLSRESEQEVLVIIIPSHDKFEQPLTDQDQWAAQGMKLLADLYQGATAFRGCSGIFKTDNGKYLDDEPILLESYATYEAIEDVGNLNELVQFLKRMGKQTEQDTVMLIIGTAFIYINDYSGV